MRICRARVHQELEHGPRSIAIWLISSSVWRILYWNATQRCRIFNCRFALGRLLICGSKHSKTAPDA